MKIQSFSISRRSFLKRCSMLGAAAGLPDWFLDRDLAQAASPRRLSLNDRPAIALIGCGGMGRTDASNASRFGDIVAVCDVDAGRAAAAAKEFAQGGKTPVIYEDARKIMERDDIQVILNVTPDHWHTLVNLAAAAAGKDVYCEKPMTLTIDEGRRVINAVRKNKIVFQTGSQQRSDPSFRLACELVRNHRLGQLKEITVWLPAGPRGGPFSAKPIPPGLNWNFWLGQAPKVDFMPERCHGAFRYWYDYSGGTMTDWGAHHNDIVLWALGLPGPVTIEGTPVTQPIPGGFTAFSDYEVAFSYSNGVRHAVKTTRDDTTAGEVANKNGQRNGIRFQGTNGSIWVNRDEIKASDESLLSTPPSPGATRLYASDDHMANFFDCIRSRKQPVADVEAGHRAASICHLGVLALRLGWKLQWDPASQKFTGEREKDAAKWIARDMRKPFDYHFI